VRGQLAEAGIDQDPDTHKDMFWKMPDWDTPTKICHSIEKRLHACITVDGEVFLCTCTAGERNLSIGNVNEEKFRRIWNGERHKNVIAKLNESPCERRNCWFKPYNKVLEVGGDAPTWKEMRERHGGIL